jgi:hypothetical protein
MEFKKTGTCNTFDNRSGICHSHTCCKRSYLASQTYRRNISPADSPNIIIFGQSTAISLTKDGSYHTRTKHIDIQYHFIRFMVQEGNFSLIYCPTEDMTVDTLTKPLPSIKAKHFAAALGLYFIYAYSCLQIFVQTVLVCSYYCSLVLSNTVF